MDQIRRILATIQKHLGGMTPTQKLLIGSLAVIVVMTLFLVTQYAGKPVMVSVWPGAGAEEQKKAAAVLKNAGFVIDQDSKGEVTVQSNQQLAAQAALAQTGQAPANSPVVFDNILKTQNWMNSKEDSRHIYKLMRDNWLSGVIGKFRGVSSAKVFVDAPDQVGFGAPAKVAKASITIFTSSGAPVSQETVDAAAKMVAGSVAGLDVGRINVIDGTTGRPCKVRTDDDLSFGTNRENARAIERDYEQKLSMVLSDIEGVVVAVTATVDTTRVRTGVTKNLATGEGTVLLPRKESSTTETETQANPAAEPGVRSNTTASINSGGAAGNKSEKKQEDTEYTSAIGVEKREIEDPRGMPTHLVATVAVPRAFIIGAIQKDAPAQAGGGGGAPAAPSEADVRARFDKEKARITQAVEPHLRTHTPDGGDVPGEVAVVMMSGSVPGGGGGAGGEGGPMGGGVGGTFGTMWALGGGVIDKAVLAVLAAVSVGMMAMMVRRAGKKVEMPTPEELVGLPPPLETKTDLVGEADETETAMAGIEVGEEEIKASKMRESVSEFIKQSPDSAAKLLNRWVSVEH